MIIVGIDNGFTGAIAIMDTRKNALEAYEMPIIKNDKNEIDEGYLVSMLTGCEHVFLEKAQVMPKQGISSSGRYMMAYGIVRGVLAALRIPYTLVTPQRWKKAMMADMPKNKGASIIAASRLFPAVKLSRKKDHGRADAILLCEFGRRLLLGK